MTSNSSSNTDSSAVHSSSIFNNSVCRSESLSVSYTRGSVTGHSYRCRVPKSSFGSRRCSDGCSMEKSSSRRRLGVHISNDDYTSASSSPGCCRSSTSSYVSGTARDHCSPSDTNSNITETRKRRRRRRNNNRGVHTSSGNSSGFIRLTSSDDGEEAIYASSLLASEQQKDVSTKDNENLFKTKSPVKGPPTHLSDAPPAKTATWVCSVAGCGARFRKKAHAERHAAVHTAERPYNCLCCSASFKRSEHLRRHCLIVHRKILASSSSGCVAAASGEVHDDVSTESSGAFAAAEEKTVGIDAELPAVEKSVGADAAEDSSDPPETPIRKIREEVGVKADGTCERGQNPRQEMDFSFPGTIVDVDVTVAAAHTAAAAPARREDRELREEPMSAGTAAEAGLSWEREVQTSSRPQELIGGTTAVAADAPTGVQRPYMCEKCGRTFVLKQHLTRHMKCHVGRYACRECDAAFAKKHQLRLHLLEHLVSRVDIERTERETTRSVQKETRETQGIEKSPSHEKGGGETGRAGRSEEAERGKITLSEAESFVKESADSKRIFLCPHQGCGAAFSSLNRLYIHLKRVSMRPRDYECETCGKDFLRFSALVAHRRAAHPANVRVCQLCSKRFSRVTRLREHIRARHGAGVTSDEDSQTVAADGASYLCPDPVCGLVFATMSNMRAHYRVKHMQLREFKCEKCDVSFGFKAVLRRHVARMHGINLDTGVTPSFKARAGIPATTQQIQPESAANLSSKRRGDSHFSQVRGNKNDRRLSLGVSFCDSRTRKSMNLPSTVDSTLLRSSGLPAEEPSRAREFPSRSKDDCCSGTSVDRTLHQTEEKLQHGKQLYTSPEVELRWKSAVSTAKILSSAPAAGGSSLQLFAEMDADFSAGQMGHKNSCRPMINKSLTCNEWIADAVQLNLLPAPADGQG